MVLSINVYRIGVDEAGRFSHLLRIMWREAKETGNLLGWSGATDEVIEGLTRDDVVQEILSQNMVYVAELEGNLIGFGALRVLSDEEGELAGIMVRESYTGMGVGKSLFKSVLDEARRLGLKRLVVKTEKENVRALSFYRKMGFKYVDETVENVHGVDVKITILSLKI